jgi:hypothetical protein
MDDQVKIVLLIDRNRLFSYVIRFIGRMHNLNSSSFWVKEVS